MLSLLLWNNSLATVSQVYSIILLFNVNFIFCQQLGRVTSLGGFDAPHRNLITNKFLPNTVQKIASYDNKAFCGVYSKQGDIFLSASQDRNIRIYDTTRGKFQLFKTILARDFGWSVLDVAFSPDGRSVCYSSWSESSKNFSFYLIISNFI